MTTLVMINLLVGMVLGQRFKALILVPASAFALACVLGIGIIRGDSLGLAVLAAASTPVSLQVGYLAGIAIRPVTALSRAGRIRALLAGSGPAQRSAR
jgi:hypothetical protein